MTDQQAASGSVDVEASAGFAAWFQGDGYNSVRVQSTTPGIAHAGYLAGYTAALERAQQENAELRAEFEKATWLLDGAAENIDEWFPNDEHPVVQGDLRKYAKQWRERYGFKTWQVAAAETFGQVQRGQGQYGQ